MRIVLIAIGRMKSGPGRELLTRYTERAQALARTVRLTGFALRELEESRGRSAAERKREEAKAIEAELPPGSWLMVMDERGRSLASEAFAESISRARDAGTPAFAL